MPDPNYQLIRFQADNIPRFDGNPRQINRFITACTNFITAHQNNTDANAPINIALFDTILGKLEGRAAEIIASRIELNNWDLVKNAIITTFADQRSIDCVVQDIITMKPEKNESSLQFGVRIQDARSLLFSKINATNEARDTKLLKINEYGNLAMKTYINGLNYHMQLVVRLKNPQSLEQAISHAQEEENFLYYKNRNNFMNRMPLNSNQNNNKQKPTQNLPQYSYRSPLSLNYSRPNYNATTYFYTPRNTNPMPFAGFGQFKPNFPGFGQFRPNAPIFGQYKPPSQQYSFNRPAFNQTQSNNSGINRTQKVEPMEVCSGNTIINKPPSQQFKQASKPNFVFEELFNQSVEPIIDNNQYNPFPENPEIQLDAYQDQFSDSYVPENFTNEYAYQFQINESANFENTDENFENYENFGNFQVDPQLNPIT